jgi:hypothetical protein
MIRIGLGLHLTTFPLTSGGTVPNLPPSVAPILAGSAEPGSMIVNLSWTASNRTTSPGFEYDIYSNGGAGGIFTLLDSTTALFYNHDTTPTSGSWEFYVKPVNDYGEGPSSNTVDVTTPGEI